MYSHELSQCGPFPALAHLRETVSSSGIITVEEIGHTVAIVNPFEDAATPAGLHIPSPEEVEYLLDGSESGFNSVPAPDRPRYTDLDEFVRAGIKRWEQLVGNLGKVLKIDTHLAQVYTSQEATRQSGLIVPTEEEEPTFQKYVGLPDEIDALERLARSVPIPDGIDETTPGSSSYL